MSHAATMFAFCWYFGEVAATKLAETCRDCPHVQDSWDFLQRLMPQGHEWSSNGPSEVPVKLTWLKFAGRVSSFYTIVPGGGDSQTSKQNLMSLPGSMFKSSNASANYSMRDA